MSQIKLHVAMAAATVTLFVAAVLVNELVFPRLSFAPGINWIYLPAGVRMLCILLFAEAGAVGLLLASWLVCFFYFFPNDPVRSIAGGILASAGPYLVYRGAQQVFGLQASLTNLSPQRLLYCALAFSLASPLLHHLWFALYEHRPDLVSSFLVMAVGDFGGTLVVLYAAKFMLLRITRRPPP
jgi:protein-S-isoprenylcysteine O-methyltransferase Ste14